MHALRLMIVAAMVLLAPAQMLAGNADTANQANQANLANAGEHAPSLTGVWEGSVLFSTVRAELVQETAMVNEQAYPFSGVVTMQSGSEKAVYHVFGFVSPDTVAGMHPPSGAQFLGSLFSPDELRGIITLKSGQQISLTAFRKPGAQPAAP